jgi:hypothetical protein
MPAHNASRPAAALEPGFRQVRQELQQLDYFLKGTVLKRLMKCGQPQCACHRDPAKRHGPYFEWTYKGQRPDRQREAQPGGCSTLSGRHQAAPYTQDHPGEDGASVANRVSSFGKAGRKGCLTPPCASSSRLQTVFRVPATAGRLSRLSSATSPRCPHSYRRFDEKSGLN